MGYAQCRRRPLTAIGTGAVDASIFGRRSWVLGLRSVVFGRLSSVTVVLTRRREGSADVYVLSFMTVFVGIV